MGGVLRRHLDPGKPLHVEPLRVGARELLGSRADHTLPHGSLLSCTVSRRSRPHATSSVHGLLKPSAGSRDSTAAQAPQPRALSSRSRTVYGLSAAALPRARSLGGSSAGPHPTLRANGCRAERGHAPGGMTPRAPRKTRHPWPRNGQGSGHTFKRQPHAAGTTNIVRLAMSSVSSLAKRTAPTMAMSRHQLVLLPRCRPARGGRGAADEFRWSVADQNPRLIGTSSPGLMQPRRLPGYVASARQGSPPNAPRKPFHRWHSSLIDAK
jgi:hypothetical protein